MLSGLHKELALKPDQCRRSLDPALLPFNGSEEVEPLEGIIGQPRAVDAIEFGLEVEARGYNLFVAGAPGSGRETTVRAYLERLAPSRPTPPDWVYVYNFADPDRPNAIPLPAGQAQVFARAMDQFVAAAQREISRAFESEDYERRKGEILSGVGHRRETLFNELKAYAREQGFALESTPVGLASLPLVDGKPVSVEAFETLPAEVKAQFARRSEELQAQVSAAIRQARQFDKEVAERIRQLDRDVALFAVGPLFDELREQYVEQPNVLAYLEAVSQDLPEHLDHFRPSGQPASEGPGPFPQLQEMQEGAALSRYRVNVFIDRDASQGAPVILEGNPTYYNLVGRVNYRATFGAFVTDFHEIKPGALHRANGGFLVLHALDVLRNPWSWDALKRTLQTREIRVENLGEQYTTLPVSMLRPEPIPLQLKIVLIGSPLLYALLYQYDENFREMFRIKVDFAPEMDWTTQHMHNYAAFIRRCVDEQGLRHFDRSAIARVIEYGSRLREDKRKLSTRLLEIANVVTESSFWAGKAAHLLVTAADVDHAIARLEYRSNLVEERILELISDGTLMIDTTGERVGTVNGVAMIDLGDYAFGKPSRITARVSLGSGAVKSIERETEMSGPIHSKGVLTLTGYLAGQYAQEYPLALAATISFEQAYEGVDGDSASSTELYALLSALSGLPIRQGIAVTGSVNQFGEVQAVGGVTRKIEGFFQVCKAMGLSGDQGVIIPAANVPHLVLNEEVVAAVRDGRFHIWAVRHIDEGIELLTGVTAGERDPDGLYPEGCVHARVEDRLRRYAETMERSGEAGRAVAMEKAPAPMKAPEPELPPEPVTG